MKLTEYIKKIFLPLWGKNIEYIITKLNTELKTMKQLKTLLIASFLTLLFSGNLSAQTLTAKDFSLVNDDVTISVKLKPSFDRDEIYRRVHYYINHNYLPYIVTFLTNTTVETRCKITDYLVVSSNAFNIFAMYMSYDLSISYADSLCVINIKNLRYMEKGDYENQKLWMENPSYHKPDFPEYTGKEILIDHSYKTLFITKASQKTEAATLKRFNRMIAHIKRYFNQIVFDENDF